MEDGFSAQAKALTIVPRIGAFLSLCGSFYIMVDVSRNGKLRTSSRHRLLMGMSFVDFISSSIGYFPSSWLVPADNVPPVYGAMGNQATCNLQGFFAQFSIAVAIYNATLSFFFWATIRLNITPKTMDRVLEPILHGIPLLFGIGTATAMIPLDHYNYVGTFGCWISGYPLGCQGDDCIRGHNANLFHWLFFYIPLWTSFCVSFLCMFMVFWTIYQQEKTMNRYRFELQHERSKISQQLDGTAALSSTTRPIEPSDDDDASVVSRNSMMSSSRRMVDALQEGVKRISLSSRNFSLSSSRRISSPEHFKYSKRIAFQGYLFCGAFYITWLFPTVFIVLALEAQPIPYWIILVSNLTLPLQGLFNMLVYLIPKGYRRNNNRYNDTTSSNVAAHSCCCWPQQRTTALQSQGGDTQQSSGLGGVGETTNPPPDPSHPL